MGDLHFDNEFYVNKDSEIDIATAKEDINLFRENMHKNIRKDIDKLKNANFPDSVWQAVIYGSSDYKFLGTTSAGFFAINSQYVVFTLDKKNLTNNSKINLFSYAFFNGEINVDIDSEENAIVLKTSVEKVLIAKGSATLQRDYDVLKELIQNNHTNFSKLAKRNSNKQHNRKPDTSRVIEKDLTNIDSRFKTNNYIISNNYIPKGFVYECPIMFSAIQGAGFKNYTQPEAGYVAAYQKCINGIKEYINNGNIDAVFNVQYTVHNVAGNYEVVVFGDGVLVDNSNNNH